MLNDTKVVVGASWKKPILEKPSGNNIKVKKGTQYRWWD
jgi:hypothetical protein